MNPFYLILAAVTGGVLYFGSRPAKAATQPSGQTLTVNRLSFGPVAMKVGDVLSILPEVQTSQGYAIDENPKDMTAIVYKPAGTPLPPLVPMDLKITKPGTLQVMWSIPTGDNQAELRNITITATA